MNIPRSASTTTISNGVKRSTLDFLPRLIRQPRNVTGSPSDSRSQVVLQRAGDGRHRGVDLGIGEAAIAGAEAQAIGQAPLVRAQRLATVGGHQGQGPGE